MEDKWFNKTVQETEQNLETNINTGLTQEQISKKLAKYGLNELQAQKKKSLFVKFLEQFKDFMIIVLIFAAIISGAISIAQGEAITDSIIILVVVIVNSIIGVAQEAKAEKSLEALQKLSGHEAKVIREGNYTNFPGFYGFLFRNADTLPLSSNTRTMIKFMQAADTILKRGDFILIYPEQSLWWNYEKPKPLKNGAYKIATRSNVPVIPIFITMKDSNIIGEDGFPIKEYYVHIEKPIYPDVTLSEKENVEKMKNENFEVWKNIYEEFYGIPLEYTTVKEEVNEEI